MLPLSSIKQLILLIIDLKPYVESSEKIEKISFSTTTNATINPTKTTVIWLLIHT